MQSGNWLASLRSSYVGASLQKLETWIAIGVTAAVTIAVAVVSHTTQPLPVDVDFTVQRSNGPPLGYTLLGFSMPAPSGSETQGQVARIILPRSLPERFELVIEGRTVRPERDTKALVRVAETALEHHFPRVPGIGRLAVQHARSTREIELVMMPGQALEIKRVAIRPELAP
jgi:hypothetical protein